MSPAHDPVPVRTAGLAGTARADLVAMCDGRAATTTVLLVKLGLHPRFRAVVMYRIAHALHQRAATRPLAGWLAGRILRSCGAEIAPASRIGPGLRLAHTTGLVVGGDVVAGRNLTLHQGVTLGDRQPGQGQPRLGDGVYVGAGAAVLGPVHVGDNAVVAAGSVVLADVPAGAVAAGVPARVVTTVRP